MPVSPEANQMSQLQGQMDPQKLMMLLALLSQQQQPQQQVPQGNPIADLMGKNPGALMGGGDPMGQQHPPTLGMGQPIPMQMPNLDPQGQQQGTPLPPNPTDMQM